MDGIRTQGARLWRVSRPLTATGIGMLLAFAAAVAAMAVDHTTILSAPTWLKPAKFAISTAIYVFTVAWIFTYLPDHRRLTAIVGWITAVVLVLEVGVIAVQAGRGVTSHFNVGTPLDMVLFSTMGIGILVAWGAAIALTVALFRHPFADGAFGWALRLGMLLTVLGQATGGLMTTPTQAQLADARTTRITVAGAHTVGAPDGGPGVPVTGWSRDHGDLRVPHFVGLHAVQLLPAMAWLMPSFGAATRRRHAVFIAAAGYVALFAILLAQALSGQSVLAPQGLPAFALALWALAVIAGLLFVFASRKDDRAADRLAVPLLAPVSKGH